ncbi:hypothetical protein [Caenispirillum salinarum]
MESGLTTATWLWLFVPMPLVVIISLVSWLRHAGASGKEGAR